MHRQTLGKFGMTQHAQKLLSCIEIDPEETAKHTIILMHGLGADGHDFVPITKELRLPKNLAVRFIFPHAPLIPVTINNGYVMRAWYDILALALDASIDHDGIIKANQAIELLIEREMARGIPSENIILAGFSQGAVMALTTGLRSQKRLGGIIALSGYLPLSVAEIERCQNHTLPIFIGHGTFDAVVPYFLGQQAMRNLKEVGFSVSWHVYPIAHMVSITEINDLSAWIQAIWH